MKTCFKCQKEKPFSEFYLHPKMNDGHLGKCKICTRMDVLANREKNVDKYRAYDRSRYRASAKRKKQYWNLSKTRPKEHIHANRRLTEAMRSGKVVRPEGCWHCGAAGKVEGHHVCYDMPLDVVWLCRSCHCKAHRQTALYEQRKAAA